MLSMPQTENTTDAMETLPEPVQVKFTPGPWGVREVNEEGDIYIVANPDSTGAEILCRVYWNGYDHDANANLIAYAPQMYSDLIDLIEVVELMPDASDPATDLYIAVNVARITLDRIREGVQS